MTELEMQFSRSAFDRWLKPAHLLAWDDGRVTIGVPDEYAKEWLESRWPADRVPVRGCCLTRLWGCRKCTPKMQVHTIKKERERKNCPGCCSNQAHWRANIGHSPELISLTPFLLPGWYGSSHERGARRMRYRE